MNLTALVDARIYPVIAPQNVLRPYVVFRRSAAERESAFGGDIGLVKTSYQISAYATDYILVRDVARQIRAAMQRWNNPSGNPEILDTFLGDDSDLFEAEVNLFNAITEASIWHRE